MTGRSVCNAGWRAWLGVDAGDWGACFLRQDAGVALSKIAMLGIKSALNFSAFVGVLHRSTLAILDCFLARL